MKESGIKPANRVRFAFWGGEEDGLYGSQHYVDELSQAEIGQTAANLNVDMAASPNGVRSVHDGDGSDFGHAGPAGSKAIEDILFRYFQENALPAETTPFDGGSDYDAFLSAGFPAAGCSPAMRRGSPRPRRGPLAGRPARSLIPATTRPATPSPTPTRNCSRKCRAPWRTPPWPTRWPRPAKGLLPSAPSLAVPFGQVGRPSRPQAGRPGPLRVGAFRRLVSASTFNGCPGAGVFRQVARRRQRRWTFADSGS